MTYSEHEIECREAYAEYKRLGGYENPEAQARLKRRHEKLNRRGDFQAFVQQVADRVIAENGFKLSKAQSEVVGRLIGRMVEAKLGREWMLNHYECHLSSDSVVNTWFDKYYDRGIFFVKMNTKTLEKLASLGIVEVIEVGGRWCDVVAPRFDFVLIEKF